MHRRRQSAGHIRLCCRWMSRRLGRRLLWRGLHSHTRGSVVHFDIRECDQSLSNQSYLWYEISFRSIFNLFVTAIHRLPQLTLTFCTDENEIANLTKCYEDDKVYHLGEKFEIAAHPCYECICSADFDNATAIADNSDCAKLDCGIEMRQAKHIRDGCVPIYYGRERCCPIDYRCRKRFFLFRKILS